MYTDAQIKSMNPKIHPAIIKNAWGKALSKEEFNDRFIEFKGWVREQRDFVVKHYGKESEELFLSLVFCQEYKHFIKAGFEFNYDYLTELIRGAKIKQGSSFEAQEITDKLLPLRSSVTTIAFTANALWGLDKIDDKAKMISTAKKMTKLANESLTLMAQGASGRLDYFEGIIDEIKEVTKEEEISVNSFIEGLKTIKKQTNEQLYLRNEDYINEPKNII